MTTELSIIEQLLQAAPENSIWCADENIADFIPHRFKGTIISNRYDIYENLKKHDLPCHFSDFNLTEIETAQKPEQIIFRVAKEKAINHHIVSSALALLPSNGKLLLLGYKNEGIVSLTATIKSHYNCQVNVKKHKKQLHSIEVISSEPQSVSLNSDIYTTLQTVAINDFNFESKPGIFGWNKIDRGSEILMEEFARQPEIKQANSIQDQSILDLGCGYGYLAIKAKQTGFNRIDATDNNAASIVACQSNFHTFDISGNVFASDCAQDNSSKYDIILCNPPFHKGFDHKKDLTEFFINQAYSHLNNAGKAYFVTNQFIGIEKIAAKLFKNVQILDKKEGFKILLLGK